VGPLEEVGLIQSAGPGGKRGGQAVANCSGADWEGERRSARGHVAREGRYPRGGWRLNAARLLSFFQEPLWEPANVCPRRQDPYDRSI
jgi:hypothetical protein